ncbi:hypothetical protein H9L21_14165 [Aeromicrobium senzhongii]|uniref:Uncharacterized protein n=1 Tax=Aeromicrobium senzhongii TaxID=2663859 RepID=A0ABX6SVC1_9ACTN|nr:hypothetical protein [Aeromicrobium senzhongii]MTB89669.1 hypothetical protein [Aeromicrobium senzhongii]QNL94205.1 hypothetical protein H9L21_14165 [Aeromicrobium senzhongii]
MKEIVNTAVVATMFFWFGLVFAPGDMAAGADIVKAGLIGTVSIIAGSVVVAYFKGEFKRPKQTGTSTRHN